MHGSSVDGKSQKSQVKLKPIDQKKAESEAEKSIVIEETKKEGEVNETQNQKEDRL